MEALSTGEAEALRVELVPEIDREGRTFVIPGSYGPDSPEVLVMGDAHERGTAIVLYELIQGMVDYGRNQIPPPRIWIEYRSGRREIFNGLALESMPEDPIVALEFINGGSGFAPEDAVINRHVGPPGTLGKNGKGMTLALCFLAQHGMRVRVSSYYAGHGWTGVTSFQPTESGATEVLCNSGQWGKKGEYRPNIFRIENPTPLIYEPLKNVGEIFLYANPRYPGAVVVPVLEGGPKIPPAVAIDVGTVQCIEGVVQPAEEGGEYTYIWVDGLRVPVPRRKTSLFPWAVRGLAEPKDDEMQVKRSHDSSRVEGPSLEVPIGLALRQIEDEGVLKKLIDYAAPDVNRRPLELQGGSMKAAMSPKTASVVRKLWRENYDNNPIHSDDDAVRKHNEYFPNGTSARVVSHGLYDFLKDAGVPAVDIKKVEAETARRLAERRVAAERKALAARERELAEREEALRRATEERERSGLKGTGTFDNLTAIDVPSARAEDNLEQLMVKVAHSGGTVEVIEIDGDKKLRIGLPGVVKTKNQLNGQTEDGTGVLVRVAAIVASVSGINYRIRSFEERIVHIIDITVTALKENSFNTNVVINSYDSRKRPEYDDCATGMTVILMEGDEINTLGNMTRLEQLIEIFLRVISEIRDRVKAATTLRRGKGRVYKKPLPQIEEPGTEEPSDADADVDTPQKPLKAQTVHRTNLGQIQISLEPRTVVLSSAGAKEKTDDLTVMPVGYHQDQVANTFTFNPATGRAEWMSEQQWACDEVPPQKPKQFFCARVIEPFAQDGPLQVPPGNKIIGYEVQPAGTDIEFFRELRTGTYSARGRAAQLVYYTAPDENAAHYQTIPPLPAEQEDVLAHDLLLPSWREFIASVNENTALTTMTKVQLALREWTKVFKYADDPALDEQMVGSSREEVAAKILNTTQGICNVSATGLAILLRALKVPTRVCRGYWKQNDYHGGRHMWLEYWNNSRWVQLESQMGIDALPSVAGPVTFVRGESRAEGGIEEETPDLPPRRLKAVAPIPLHRSMIYALILGALGLATVHTKYPEVEVGLKAAAAAFIAGNTHDRACHVTCEPE